MKSTLLALALISFVCSAETTPGNPIGLVLGGGGAKGAYQIGVWETLVETGWAQRVRAISGTSVGAINAALFATCSDTGRMERVWLESLPKVMVPNQDRIRDVVQSIGEGIDEPYLAELRKELMWRSELVGVSVSEFPKEWADAIAEDVAKRHPGASVRGALNRIIDEVHALVATTNAVPGVIDSDALRTLIRDNLPDHWSDGAPSAYATSLEKGTWKLVSWGLNDRPPERRIDMILSSAAIPGVFDSSIVDGIAHVDGGWDGKGGDNAPINPIIDNHPDVKMVVVVYLNDAKHVVGRIRKERYPQINIIEIVPSQDLGQWITGSLNFDTEKAKQLIELGRSDARKRLKEAGLAE